MTLLLTAAAFAASLSSTTAIKQVPPVDVAVQGVSAGQGELQRAFHWGAIWQHMQAAAVVLEQRAQKEPAWVRLWRGDETIIPDEPEWITHTVTPGERTTQIAVRYGVKARKLMAWNRIRSSYSRLRTGRKLKVLANRIPVPRQSLVHRVGEDESWDDIAAIYRVGERMLRSTNPKLRHLEPGDAVTVWYDPGLPWTVGRQLGEVDLLTYEVPQGAESYGRPDMGRLLNAVQVPDSPLYRKRSPNLLWGSTHAIDLLMGSIARFRYETGYDGEVQLNSMSLRRGRSFAPHKSHQSGRDVDIHIPLLPGVAYTSESNPDEIDWLATWELVRVLLETEQVVYIFLDTDRQIRLYEAARAMGESHEALAEVIEWAHGSRKRSIIRHAPGHDGHLHVRFRCGPHERHCYGSGGRENEPTHFSLRRRHFGEMFGLKGYHSSGQPFHMDLDGVTR